MSFLQETKLNITDLARRWGISHKTVTAWAEKGVLPQRHQIGTLKFWTEDQILQWEEVNIKKAEVQHG